MAVQVLQPSQVVDQSGNPVYASAHSDKGLISVRTSAILTTAQVLMADNTTDFESGKIQMQGCPVIYLYVTYTKGSSTSVTITPRFGWSSDLDYLPMVAEPPSSGVVVADNSLAFQLTGTKKVIIPVINPGAEFVQFYAVGVGIMTGSLLAVSVMRGFNNHVGYVA